MATIKISITDEATERSNSVFYYIGLFCRVGLLILTFSVLGRVCYLLTNMAIESPDTESFSELFIPKKSSKTESSDPSKSGQNGGNGGATGWVLTNGDIYIADNPPSIPTIVKVSLNELKFNFNSGSNFNLNMTSNPTLGLSFTLNSEWDDERLCFAMNANVTENGTIIENLRRLWPDFQPWIPAINIITKGGKTLDEDENQSFHLYVTSWGNVEMRQHHKILLIPTPNTDNKTKTLSFSLDIIEKRYFDNEVQMCWKENPIDIKSSNIGNNYLNSLNFEEVNVYTKAKYINTTTTNCLRDDIRNGHGLEELKKNLHQCHRVIFIFKD